MPTYFPVDCLDVSRTDVKVLACPPELVLGNDLIATVLPVMKCSGVLLDMSAVRTIDAAGVGSLVTLRKLGERFGTTLSLIKPTRRTREILQVVGLDSVLLCENA